MRVWKYLNQRVRRIGEKNGKSFKGVLKTKRKKHIKRLSFITQFKIEFLLPYTGCNKVLEKNASDLSSHLRQTCYDYGKNCIDFKYSENKSGYFYAK